MQKNNEIKSKKIRSTSSLSKEHKIAPNNFNQSEKENTNNENNNNTNSNYKKGLHHRKRTSSYFLGSYIPNSNILESNQEKDDDININLNINNNLYNNFNENSKDKEDETSSEIKNKFIYNLINNDSNNNVSLSFPSYDESNTNNSLVIKQQNSSNKKSNNKSNSKNENYNRNNIYYEMAKDAENSSNCKSFISFKNTLKYIKDKDERTTPSYLLALQTDKKGGNNNYVTSSNIIEEEKSSMLESKSEYSNKKEIFHFEKKRLQDTNEKTNYILEDIDGNIKGSKDNRDNKDYKDIINNKINLKNYKDKNSMKKQISHNNSMQDENSKITSALNEIIIKNNKKEENRRKYLTKNKMTLLNTFFTMSKTFQMNEDKINNKIIIENYKDNKDIKDKGINQIVEKKENNNLNYYMKRKYVNKFLKKSFINKRVVDPRMNMEGQ